jgi:hypothetical protein
MDIESVAGEGLKELGKAAAKEAWEQKSWLLDKLSRVSVGFHTPGSTEAKEAQNRGF